MQTVAGHFQGATKTRTMWGLKNILSSASQSSTNMPMMETLDVEKVLADLSVREKIQLLTGDVSHQLL